MRSHYPNLSPTPQSRTSTPSQIVNQSPRAPICLLPNLLVPRWHPFQTIRSLSHSSNQLRSSHLSILLWPLVNILDIMNPNLCTARTALCTWTRVLTARHVVPGCANLASMYHYTKISGVESSEFFFVEKHWAIETQEQRQTIGSCLE